MLVPTEVDNVSRCTITLTHSLTNIHLKSLGWPGLNLWSPAFIASALELTLSKDDYVYELLWRFSLHICKLKSKIKFNSVTS